MSSLPNWCILLIHLWLLLVFGDRAVFITDICSAEQLVRYKVLCVWLPQMTIRIWRVWEIAEHGNTFLGSKMYFLKKTTELNIQPAVVFFLDAASKDDMKCSDKESGLSPRLICSPNHKTFKTLFLKLSLHEVQHGHWGEGNKQTEKSY